MNADHAYSTLGPCEDYEFELVEYVDGALTAERRNAIADHLQSCGRCRAFAQEFAAVTDALAQALPRVELSAEFSANLQARLAELPPTSDKATARARAEHEYRRAITSLRRGLGWRSALNAVATASVCGGVLQAISSVAPRVLHSLGLAQPTLVTTSLALAGVAAFGGLLAAITLQRSPPAPPFA